MENKIKTKNVILSETEEKIDLQEMYDFYQSLHSCNINNGYSGMHKWLIKE